MMGDGRGHRYREDFVWQEFNATPPQCDSDCRLITGDLVSASNCCQVRRRN